MHFVKKNLEIDGLKLAYLDNQLENADQTVVVYPPGAHSSDTFVKLFANAQNISSHLIIVDYPGRGDSDILPSEDNFASFADIFLQFQEKLALKNVIGMGFSFGTMLITTMLSINLVAFSKVFLVTPGEYLKPQYRKILKTVFKPAQYSPKVRNLYYQLLTRIPLFVNLKSTDPESILEQWTATLNFHIPAKSINTPALLVFCKNDNILNPESKERVRKFYAIHQETVIDFPHLEKISNSDYQNTIIKLLQDWIE
ncbi:MAG: alpha/beta fold hydrolase [bacterium]